MERYYQPEIETASREQIRAWQDERLVKQVKHVWDNVPYYRKKMEEAGLLQTELHFIEKPQQIPEKTTVDGHRPVFETMHFLQRHFAIVNRAQNRAAA